MRMTDQLSDRDVMETTVAEIAAAISEVLSRGWALSPHATALATARGLACLSLALVKQHPDQRDAIVANLQSLADLVAVETGAKH
jgi:hypothetical protein